MRPLQPQLTFWESLQSYGSLFVRAMRSAFAYRASTLTGLVTAVFMYAIPLLVWRQVYANAPGELTVPRSQMFPYLLLACCANYALGMGIEMRIGQRIRQGLIATDLLKPVDFQVAQGAQTIGENVFHGMLGIAVFLCGWAFLGNGVLPAEVLAVPLFLASFALAFVIQYCVCFIFVQGAFYTYSGYGIFAARAALHQTFSGLFAPLALYPEFLRAAGEWLPFQHIIHTPVSLYMGWAEGWDALRLLGEQFLWAAGLFLLGKALMKVSLKQLEVQGG